MMKFLRGCVALIIGFVAVGFLFASFLTMWLPIVGIPLAGVGIILLVTSLWFGSDPEDWERKF